MIGLRIFAIASMFVIANACVHTQPEERKEDYQSRVDEQIDAMQDNIDTLSERSNELLGEPKQELTSAIDSLKSKTQAARSELQELQARNTTTWVEKKPAVDRQLYEMEQAYTNALEVFHAH